MLNISATKKPKPNTHRPQIQNKSQQPHSQSNKKTYAVKLPSGQVRLVKDSTEGEVATTTLEPPTVVEVVENKSFLGLS